MQGCEKEGPLLKDGFMIHPWNYHDFQLITLLVVDEFGAGCPVAFCLSNRIDTVAMSRYFVYTRKILVSDDNSTYINAWSNIMSNPDYHLLCKWHVDRSWRKNLNKKNRKDIINLTQQMLSCLNKPGQTFIKSYGLWPWLSRFSAFSNIFCFHQPTLNYNTLWFFLIWRSILKLTIDDYLIY
ncbi:SWIM-type domain-containing protein [Aphis craccivora]|uniref:SWIM-type domain-containing protein n=1 Tax=Aphis craccivora TaxID=307492 RepID=A0A6G0XE37_APHCR|nr:SWIM-type domain-containing protein [Aphis craccivora]